MAALSFADLLARADDEALQELVGPAATKLLSLLDPSLARPSSLRTVCTGLHPPSSLLLNPVSWKSLCAMLRPTEAQTLAQRLAVDGPDYYEGLADVSIRRGSERESALLGFFGLAAPERPSREQAPLESPAVAGYALFSHQRRASRQVLDLLGQDPRRVLLHMPTGSGKTRTAMHVIASRLREVEPGLAVWLAYSEELCEQAAEEFEKAWAHLGDRDLPVYRYWGSSEQLESSEVTEGFVVAGLAKTYARAKRDIDFLARLADRSHLVVIDEAHQAIAETYRFLLNFLVERDRRSALLGLTATPGRTWDDPEADEELANFFSRKKVTLSVPGYDSPVDYLIEEGYLARPHFRELQYTPADELTAEQLREVASSLDIPPRILALLADDEQRNLVVVSAVEDLLQRHSRILVFAASVEHSDLLATVLRARDKEANSLTGTTPTLERSRITTRFKSNHPGGMVLCNFGVLTTGFDAPRTSAALIARPTKSLVLYSQMVGRAIRGTLSGGNAEAEILTVVDTQLPGFRSMGEAFMNWEDVWDV